MARNGKHTKTDLMEHSALIPYAKKPTSTQSLQDQLIETKLRIEQAKLAKLEAELQKDEPKYMRYEDMPPPSPEQEREFLQRFEMLITNLDKLGPKPRQSLQEWIKEQGGEVPDHPNWQTPQYMEYPTEDLGGSD